MQIRHWDAATPEEANALEEMETASDRAVGIVAATFVESRLRSALEQKLVDEPKIRARIYNFSGPFGSFSAKIDVGRLLGLYSQDSWKDLVTIKDIRNDFAHEPFATSFSGNSIRDRCFNLKIAETNVVELGDDGKGVESFIAVEGKAEMLNNARVRYLTACQFFSKMFFMWGQYGAKLPGRPPSF